MTQSGANSHNSALFSHCFAPIHLEAAPSVYVLSQDRFVYSHTELGIHDKIMTVNGTEVYAVSASAVPRVTTLQ